MSKAIVKRTPINNLYYFSAKTKKYELTYDQIIKAAKHITRANDRTKTIGNKQAKFLLAELYSLIKKSENGVIYITHDFISEITDCSPRQNANILSQLTDIFEHTYHRYIAEIKMSYCYEIKLTTDGEKRLVNPELFYEVNVPQESEKNYSISSKKLPVIAKKITASIYNDNKQDYNNKDNNDNCNDHIIVSDNENNQEIISCNFGDLMINEESVTTSQQENHFRDCYSSSITSAETLLSSSKTIIKDGIPRKRVRGLDGKMHYAIPLAKFKFDNEALDEIIYVSSREEFSRIDVVNVIQNILKKQPDKLIYGGRNGFIQYMIKAVEREYGIKKGNLDNKTNTTEYINQIRIEAMNTTLEQGNEIRWL
jgi:hypothetical protein